jgi:hypothetical protein
MPLKFEPPPPPRFGPAIRQIPEDAPAELIAHTGEWAVVWTGASGTAYNVASGIRRSTGRWRGHTWEAVVRRQPDRKTAKVYARHIAALEK